MGGFIHFSLRLKTTLLYIFIFFCAFFNCEVDLLDTTGTLYSMSHAAGVCDENGDFPTSTWAFSSDAIATIIGALLGKLDLSPLFFHFFLFYSFIHAMRIK